MFPLSLFFIHHVVHHISLSLITQQARFLAEWQMSIRPTGERLRLKRGDSMSHLLKQHRFWFIHFLRNADVGPFTHFYRQDQDVCLIEKRSGVESGGGRRGKGWHNNLCWSLMRQLCLPGFYWSSSSHRLEPSVQPLSVVLERILAQPARYLSEVSTLICPLNGCCQGRTTPGIRLKQDFKKKSAFLSLQDELTIKEFLFPKIPPWS